MPLVAALIGAVAISFSAVWFELSDVDAVTGSFFRAGYALPFLFIVWRRRRSLDHRGRRDHILALLAGIFLAGDFIAWHLAIDQIGAGLASLIVNCQVVIVSLLAWVMLAERPSRQVLAAIPVVLVGVALVSGLGQDVAFGDDPLLGTIFGLTSAMFYALFLLVFRHSNRTRSPAAGPLFQATVGAMITSALASPLLGGLDLVPSWPAHGWLVALAVGSQVVGWLAITYALPRLPAAETSTIIVVQPALTMIWGALLFAERPSPIQLTGAALLLLGVGMVAVVSSRRRPLPAPV